MTGTFLSRVYPNLAELDPTPRLEDNKMKNTLNRIAISSLAASSLLVMTLPSVTAQEQPRPIDPNVHGNAGTAGPAAPVAPPAAMATPGKASARASSIGPGGTKAKILNKLQEILDEQDRFGQRPSNNPLLADLENVIRKHSVVSHPTVEVINFGPGTVQLNKPDGTLIVLKPNFVVDMPVGTGPVNLATTNDFSRIQLRHSANGPCRFWDGDDRQFSVIEPGRSGPSKKIAITLGRGLRHYHLEQ